MPPSLENSACCPSERYQHEASSSTAVKTVGEPDARNPHVRFDERGWEPERATSRPRPSSTLPTYLTRPLRISGLPRFPRVDRRLAKLPNSAVFAVNLDDFEAFLAMKLTEIMYAWKSSNRGVNFGRQFPAQGVKIAHQKHTRDHQLVCRRRRPGVRTPHEGSRAVREPDYITSMGDDQVRTPHEGSRDMGLEGGQ